MRILRQQTETLTVCEEDSKRIQAAAEKYAVKGYLSESEIRQRFRFDRDYASMLAYRKKQKSKTFAKQEADYQAACALKEKAKTKAETLLAISLLLWDC